MSEQMLWEEVLFLQWVLEKPTQGGNSAHPHNLQFSEESVSSLEPSLSASIFRQWCRGFQGELILGELRTGKFAVSPLELVGPEIESPET